MKTIAIVSGGMDSVTMLHQLVKNGNEVKALSIDYGQKHGTREMACAAWQCRHLDVPWTVADMRGVTRLMSDSALTDPARDVPEGHYADESMKATVVPNRNMLLLAVATACAINEGYDSVAYGAHTGDHPIYPDCRPEFANAMAAVMRHCHYEPINLVYPFEFMDKTEVCKLGAELGVNFSHTWSCYNGRDIHCGKCGTCVERKEAFELSGVPDPTDYEA